MVDYPTPPSNLAIVLRNFNGNSLAKLFSLIILWLVSTFKKYDIMLSLDHSIG